MGSGKEKGVESRSREVDTQAESVPESAADTLFHSYSTTRTLRRMTKIIRVGRVLRHRRKRVKFCNAF